MGTLALLVAVGLLGPILAAPRRLGLPVIVGEILAGIIVGPHGLGWLHPEHEVAVVLHDAGFALLMFVVGLRLPVRDKTLYTGLRRGAIATGITVVVAIGIGLLIARQSGLGHAAAIITVLATSSAAIAMPILREGGTKGEVSGPRAAAAAWILFADIATVLALPLVAHSGPMLRVVLASLTLGALGALAVLIYHLANKSNRWEVVRHESKTHEWGLDLRISLVLVFAFTWLAAKLGTSALVAGFTAGVAVAFSGHVPKRLIQQLVGVGEGFLIPIFFVVLGSHLDVGALGHPKQLLLAGELLLGTVVAHSLAARVLREPIGVGFVATAQMGVPAALVTIGQAQHWMPAGVGAAFMAAALGSIGTSSLGNALLRRNAPPPRPAVTESTSFD
jgi:Kef-type K+ transport system membrane component KefB